ncbi:hypothetical protein OIV83_000728 [Microbotryomycetes sp. JL201]|nr:hypothetical protein OIV83_000728 [Microbotryomycetes sp. JL201]
MTGHGASVQDAVWLQSAVLTGLRCLFVTAARRYVQQRLFNDLRQVEHDSSSASHHDKLLESPSAKPSTHVPLDDLAAVTDDSVEQQSALGLGPPPPLQRTTPPATTTRHSGTLSPNSLISNPAAVTYTRVATVTFCVAFSESCMLFTLLLFGEAVNDRTRSLNWSVSLVTLLLLIVVIIPLGLCVLVTHRNKPASSISIKTALLTLVPFGGYLFVFERAGKFIAAKAVIEGSHSIGVVNAMLSRVCIPGTLLIATLTGSGAMTTAWEAYEWRSVSTGDPVSDAQILNAERSLYRSRLDLQQRYRSMELAKGAAQRESDSAATTSLLSRLTSANPAATHLKSLETEIKAMEIVEANITKDVATLKRRKELRDMGRTFKGRLWLAAGWLLSVYCVWRVFTACVNLIFGYTRTVHRHSEASAATEGAEGTDLLTSLLSRLASLLEIDIDIAMWSRLLGLVLLGSIILANMRNALKAASSGISVAVMLLFLAQLMALYFITSLISLPSSPSEASEHLLDTLPSFAVFSRLFDLVFLVAACTTFVIRLVGNKMKVQEGLTAQYV